MWILRPPASTTVTLSGMFATAFAGVASAVAAGGSSVVPGSTVPAVGDADGLSPDPPTAAAAIPTSIRPPIATSTHISTRMAVEERPHQARKRDTTPGSGVADGAGRGAAVTVVRAWRVPGVGGIA